MTVQFLILTPMVEELQPVAAIFKSTAIVHNNRVYHICGTRNDPRVVIHIVGYGQERAAAAAALANEDWRPDRVLLVGIAGGNTKLDVKLGDVLVPKRIYPYEPAKLYDDYRESRGQYLSVHEGIHSSCQELFNAKWTDALLDPPQQAGQLPHVHFDGSIASGNKVIASKKAMNELQKKVPDLLGVEMEAYGVFRALQQATPVPAFLTVRGICDLADANKSDKWHCFAAHTAAIFAKVFVASVLSASIPTGKRVPTKQLPPLLTRAFSYEKLARELDILRARQNNEDNDG
jgi:nucleoside phosphorylase